MGKIVVQFPLHLTYVDRNQNMALSLFVFVIALLMVTLPSVASADNRGVLGVCIQNCGQCKRMYGDFFYGQQCAEECLHTFGFSTPDCNKASSIQRFLGFSPRRHRLRI